MSMSGPAVINCQPAPLGEVEVQVPQSGSAAANFSESFLS
jgi:hypothetical protein